MAGIPKYVNKYEMVPPEGGWGYVVTLAVSLIFIVSVVPISAFGMVFGPFLASLGDETGATTLVNGVLNTSLFLSGLPVNQLLQRYSYRKVGLLGAAIYFAGTFGTIFATSVLHMIITFGVFQGLGFGLMMSSGFTAFHEYFHLKQNVMMSICQSIIGGAGIVFPAITHKLLENYGFRGTAALFAALSLNGILAVSTFQPARWHFKKKLIRDTEMARLQPTVKTEALDPEARIQTVENQSMEENTLLNHGVPLIAKPGSNNSLNKIAKDLSNEKKGLWKSVSESLDLELFKDPLYVNLAVGTSCAMVSDIMFISIFPLLLVKYGFEAKVPLIMTIYFSADLTGRIVLSVLSAMFPIWNRYVVLTGAILSSIFRIAFTMDSSFWWTICTCAVLGFIRPCIQIPFPLVFAEQYGPRFKTAFTLNMVVCGIMSLIVGVLSGWIKATFHSDIMVVHMLTVAYMMCAVPWLIEIFTMKVLKKKK